MLGSSGFRRAALVVTGSLLAGVAATLIVQTWLEIIEGSWAANAAALSLTVLAIAAAVAGGYSLLGERGAVLAALTMVLVGNPFSAVGSAPELLPSRSAGSASCCRRVPERTWFGALASSTARRPAATSPCWWRGRSPGWR